MGWGHCNTTQSPHNVIWDPSAGETKHRTGREHKLDSNSSWDLNAIWRAHKANWGPQTLAEDPQNQPGTSALGGNFQQCGISNTSWGGNTGWGPQCWLGLSLPSRDPQCWLGTPSNIWGPPMPFVPPSNGTWDHPVSPEAPSTGWGSPTLSTILNNSWTLISSWDPNSSRHPNSSRDPCGGCDPGGFLVAVLAMSPGSRRCWRGAVRAALTMNNEGSGALAALPERLLNGGEKEKQ